MEKSERNIARWVDDRLAALRPAADFRPDVPKALARVQERERAYRLCGAPHNR